MAGKKGDISLTTIIIAIIVILVLVVLVVVFSRGMGNFSFGAKSCVETRGGQCGIADCSDVSACSEYGCAKVKGTDCTTDRPVCCVPIVKPQ